MKKLDKLFNSSRKIKIDKNTKIVIMSDCHRGTGNNYDNFHKNAKIYEAALKHYYDNNFMYIELGDGDDLWEVKDIKEIINEHIKSFKLLKNFHDDNKLIMIYGNHDMDKKKEYILKKYYYKYYNNETKKEEDLLNNLVVYESLILDYNNHDLFLLHGHQADLLNGPFWRLSKFLVRNVWRNLEHLGIKDPTNSAKNNEIKKGVEKKLDKWSKQNNIIVISGHTHRPIFPQNGTSLYFNDGSCVHPNGITCIEIENGHITLVKWLFKLKKGNTITVGRKVIEGSELIDSYFIK